MERFFAELEARLVTARQKDRQRYRNFFGQLQPEFQAARKIETELNRHLAHRFNVLDYLRTDELGLSAIIADLLKPDANHGQGTLFLQTLLHRLEVKNVGASESHFTRTEVFVEQVIQDQRRIDVYVRIPVANGTFCLAIENKPYTTDRENQVVDYLEHLRNTYADRFLLIYLSPTGEGPTESSLPRTDLSQWRGHMVVMPYHVRSGNDNAGLDDSSKDPFTEFRARCSLTDWLATCRVKCQVERLRWFLGDTETFCQRRFGGYEMTTDSEARALKDYLCSNPEQLLTAQVVHASWPAIKEYVCGRFLEHLRDRIEQEAAQKLSKFAHDIRIGCKYGGEKRWVNRLWLYRLSWCQYELEESDSNRRTSIRLEADSHGPKGWCFGVSSPMPEKSMSDKDRDRRLRLDFKLKEALIRGTRGDCWPVWDWAHESRRDWNSLLPDLHKECEENGGDITDYYVRTFIDVAKKAIPIIDELEGA